LAFANVLCSTRHATILNAAVYQNVAATQLAFLKRDNFLTDHSVSMWESIHIEDRGTTRGICGPSEFYQKDITYRNWQYIKVTAMLKIKITGTVTVRQTVDAARKYGTKTKGLATAIEDLLRDKLPKDEVAKIMAHVHKTVQSKIEQICKIDMTRKVNVHPREQEHISASTIAPVPKKHDGMVIN
jgi:hypothetical protein